MQGSSHPAARSKLLTSTGRNDLTTNTHDVADRGSAAMLNEAAAIDAAARRLDTRAFTSAFELLLSCPGKVILTGVGTSGIVARKLASTITSTGTQAIFLHPADALHGGLGTVDRQDVVVAISNSGETAELKALLPYLEARHIPVIAITGKLGSVLARRAAVALDASVDREACPYDIVPTSSVIVAQALGDALALTPMEARGITPDDFAQNHPAGALGKRLTLRVQSVMHPVTEQPVLQLTSPWETVISSITRGGLGGVVVVDGPNRLRGIITDGDVRRAVERNPQAKLAALRAADVMTTDPVVVSSSALAFDAMRLMEDRDSQLSLLPVTELDGTCIGVVRLHDLVRAGLS